MLQSDSILSSFFAKGTDRHLVSEPSPWVGRPLGAWLRMAQSEAFLPYPGSLPRPLRFFKRSLVASAVRVSPQFDDLAGSEPSQCGLRVD